MPDTVFLRPRLRGARFEDHAIPLEVLKDLAVLQEMVIEVAKWKYLQEHPGRQRSPKGFTDSVELKLTGIEEGSAIPVITLAVAGLHLPTLTAPNRHYLETARDAIVSAIHAADTGDPITSHLPPSTLGYFDRLGRGLREDEAIEFLLPDRVQPARLNRDTRRRLILAAPGIQELTEDCTVWGTIPEADQQLGWFTLQRPDGQRVAAPISPEHWETIRLAFNGYSTGVRVRIQGVGRFDRVNQLKKLDAIEHISTLDPLDVPARLDEFRRLRDGWLEGEGRAPTGAGLDWLSAAFERHYSEDLPLPHLYPTAGGGVRAEWVVRPYDFSLEIDLSRQMGEWHALNLDTDVEETGSLNLADPAGWQSLVDVLRPCVGGPA
jgi:hypothetical protein